MAAHPTIRAVMGWLPLGSGNDLARAHGVPRDPAHAITGYANIATGAADVGLVEYGTLNDGRTATIFGNSLTFGVTATVLEQMTRGNTPHRGPLSYFLAALRGFVSHTPLEVAVDGAAGTFRVVSITNGPTFGAGMLVTPMARLDDGALDLLTVSGISRLRTTLLFPRIYWGGHLRHPAVRHRQIRQLTIDAAGPLSFEVDGELMSGFPPFQVSVIAAGLPVAKPVHDHSS